MQLRSRSIRGGQAPGRRARGGDARPAGTDQLREQQVARKAAHLESLPEDILMIVMGQLGPCPKGNLRLVSKLMRSRVNQQVTRVRLTHLLSGCQADRLRSFPRLTSLTFVKPTTTFHIAALTKLTKVSLRNDHYDYPDEEVVDRMSVDLGSLACLPRLHTLVLQGVAADESVQYSAMSGLTQLQALELFHCSGRPSSHASAHDLSCLSQLTKLQVTDSPVWLSAGLVNLQKVEIMELHLRSMEDCVLKDAVASCTALHTLVLVGACPLRLSTLAPICSLQCLALNLCAGLAAEQLLGLTSLRYLDMSNCCLGTTAGNLGSTLESMPLLELCILTVTTHPDYFSFATSWQQGHLSKVLARLLSTDLVYDENPEHTPQEWWLATAATGDFLHSEGLLHDDIWDQLRQTEPQTSDCKLLAFLKQVAAGHSYQATPSQGVDAHDWTQELPGQSLLCNLCDGEDEYKDLFEPKAASDDELSY